MFIPVFIGLTAIVWEMLSGNKNEKWLFPNGPEPKMGHIPKLVITHKFDMTNRVILL